MELIVDIRGKLPKDALRKISYETDRFFKKMEWNKLNYKVKLLSYSNEYVIYDISKVKHPPRIRLNRGKKNIQSELPTKKENDDKINNS